MGLRTPETTKFGVYQTRKPQARVLRLPSLRPLQGGNSAGAGNIEPSLQLRALIGVAAILLAEVAAVLPAMVAALDRRGHSLHPAASCAP